MYIYACVYCAFVGLGDKLYKMHGTCIKIGESFEFRAEVY